MVSDTSYPGYDEVPRYVMQGYGIMAAECLAQSEAARPTHLILQAGVGGLAAAVAARFWLEMGRDRPRIILVESDRAACFIASVRNGAPRTVQITEETVMAGLSCGEVSLLAWPVLQKCVDHYVAVADSGVAPVMRALAGGALGGGKIEGGECATTGLLALIAAARAPDLRHRYGLDDTSRILVIGTEGATDPDIYRQMVGEV